MGVILAACLLVPAQQPQQAPDFVGRPTDWIHSKPQSLKRLAGKVVLVDFWEYTCVNCIRTFPYVKAWYRRYKGHGFEVVAIHSPEFEFTSQRSNVLAAAKRFGLTFPILLDNGKQNWANYRVEGWPTKVLLDARGVPIYAHSGEGESEKFEKLIQRELRRAKPGLKMPPIMKPVFSAHQIGAICNPKTPEIFTGSRGHRDGQFAQSGPAVGKTAKLTMLSARPRGKLVLGGTWRFAGDHIESAALDSAVAFNFAGVEANAVLRPSKLAEVEVLLNGKPVPAGYLGDDVRMKNGRTIVRAQSPRMYNLVKSKVWGRHDLELRLRSPGIKLYTFSFSTDCARINPSAR